MVGDAVKKANIFTDIMIPTPIESFCVTKALNLQSRSLIGYILSKLIKDGKLACKSRIGKLGDAIHVHLF